MDWPLFALLCVLVASCFYLQGRIAGMRRWTSALVGIGTLALVMGAGLILTSI